MTIPEQVEAPPARPERLTLTCVVPAFNEGRSIARFLDALHEGVVGLAAAVEIIVVNDGSRDDTRGQVLALSRRLPIHYLELSRNFGKELALQAGLDAARGDCVVMLDADFQHPISLIPDMIARWRSGADMVYAVQRDRRGQPWMRRVGTRMFYWMLSSADRIEIPPNAGDFRLMDRSVVMALRRLPERVRLMKGLYAWVGYRSEAIEFVAGERPEGGSRFSLRRLARLGLTGITSFSSLPLQFVMLAGFVVSAIACLMGAWIVFERIFLGQPIPGFATVAAAVFLLSGVQLISLGVVGEYVARIFDEVKRRPLYLLSMDVDRSPVSPAPWSGDRE